ncbi:MAG: AAA family ATPase [Nanoarchaeota archaeon]|nr:AAA family ATPase [Nanoarchaeota archaeon]
MPIESSNSRFLSKCVVANRTRKNILNFAEYKIPNPILSMCYFVIIRGPAGVGKTAVAKKLAARLGGTYISFDKIMRENNLDKIEGTCIKARNFIKANEIAIPEALKNLKNGKIVVFDGCFYHKSQAEHLIKNIPFNNYTFTLKATLNECILRDKKRSNKAQIGEKRVREVYFLVSRIDYGVAMNTAKKAPEEIATECIFRMPKIR